MNGRSTLIAFLCASLLGGFWYFYEFKGKDSRSKAALEAKLVFPELASQQASELVLHAGNAEDIVVQKAGTQWLLTKPLVAQGDRVPIQQILAQLKDLKNEGEVAQQSPGVNLAQFGLEPVLGSLTFKGASLTAQTLFFGADNPSQQYSYCQVSGKPSVFMISRYAKMQMMKGVKDLRDKTVWEFEPESVSKVRSNFGKGLSLEKDKKDQWQLLRPRRSAAASGAVTLWLQQLKGFRIDEFVNEGRVNPAKYGLDDGKRIELILSSMPKPMVLIQGSKMKSGKGRYYQMAGRPLVFSMSDIAGQALAKDAAELISKTAQKK